MFNDALKLIIEASGGSMDKVDLGKFMESINHSFLSEPSHWLGTSAWKTPLDMMILQEIIFEKRPDTIIECGTYDGGSAYYMACLMDLINIEGKIYTIDHEVREKPAHPKIEYIYSECLAVNLPKTGSKTMVILDCDHSAEHVYAELQKFSGMVSIGQYIIVEDTDAPDKAHGPAAAVEWFLSNNKNFVVDKSREKYGISSNLGGVFA